MYLVTVTHCAQEWMTTFAVVHISTELKERIHQLSSRLVGAGAGVSIQEESKDVQFVAWNEAIIDLLKEEDIVFVKELPPDLVTEKDLLNGTITTRLIVYPDQSVGWETIGPEYWVYMERIPIRWLDAERIVPKTS